MSEGSIVAEQRHRLEAMITWAKRIRSELGPVLRTNSRRVHFRPGSTGVAMVGLLPDRPQRGKSGIRDLQHLADDFERQFTRHCVDVSHGRVTGEKTLQSFLIADAQTHDGHFAAINEASSATAGPVDLVFVTDEISLPLTNGKIVCDMLALRVDGHRSTPVLLELKDSRQMTRLIEQVDSYARLIDEHADLFAALYAALTEREVVFDAPTEKWIVWPMVGENADPREAELVACGVRAVGYTEEAGRYAFRVGGPSLPITT